METGKIARLVSDKNFGFIKVEGKDKDVFFHQTALQGVEFTALKEGDEVSFEMEESDKGPKAVNVSLVSKE
jgi:CspA family cold shock protein